MERKASTIRGAFKYGINVEPKVMEKIDLVLMGSVAVNRSGERLGKGGGYSSLEFGIAKDFGLITDETPTVTTVHPLQIVKEKIPLENHDVPLDWIVTPIEAIETKTTLPRPKGILWKEVKKEQLAKIPLLNELKQKTEREI